jgi:hypothetical protein
MEDAMKTQTLFEGTSSRKNGHKATLPNCYLLNSPVYFLFSVVASGDLMVSPSKKMGERNGCTD